MEILLTLGNAWNEVFLLSVVLFVITVILLGIMFVLVEKVKLISGTLVALLAGFFGLATRFTFITSMILGVIKLITKIII